MEEDALCVNGKKRETCLASSLTRRLGTMDAFVKA